MQRVIWQVGNTNYSFTFLLIISTVCTLPYYSCVYMCLFIINSLCNIYFRNKEVIHCKFQDFLNYCKPILIYKFIVILKCVFFKMLFSTKFTCYIWLKFIWNFGYRIYYFYFSVCVFNVMCFSDNALYFIVEIKFRHLLLANFKAVQTSIWHCTIYIWIVFLQNH